MIPNLCRQDPKLVRGVTISDATQVVQSCTERSASDPKSVHENEIYSGKAAEQARRGVSVPFAIHTYDP